jgi:hypothetical protein
MSEGRITAETFWEKEKMLLTNIFPFAIMFSAFSQRNKGFSKMAGE